MYGRIGEIGVYFPAHKKRVRATMARRFIGNVRFT